jgi:polysaccharide biosynthesis transport protein
LASGAAPAESGMALGDIYYILFRHKWKIVIAGLVGLIAAATVYWLRPPLYESEAKLFVRYVTEGKTLGPPGDDTKTISTDPRGMTILNTEVEILTSLDIANQVADVVGPDKILGKVGSKDRNKAAALIQRNLTVEVPVGSSVIHVLFKHPDASIVQPVLGALIDTYLKKHVEIHAAVGIVGDFLTQETDQLRTRLSQTEDDLRKATAKAGVVSVQDAQKAFPIQEAEIQAQIFNAEAELAERSSLYDQLTKRNPATPATSTSLPEPTADQIAKYKDASARVDMLQKRQDDLLTQFTPENTRVQEVRALLSQAQADKTKLETESPQLLHVQISSTPATSARADAIDPATEAAHLNALQAKIKVLNSQLEEIRGEAAKVDQMEVTIQELQRQKDLEEANYKYYEASLEQSRINEALGTGKVSNISQIQTPSPPALDWGKTPKIVAGVAISGFALGLAWAFLIELYLDRTVRRPIDIERILGVPLFLSIPDIGSRNFRRRIKAAAKERSKLPEDADALAASADAHPLHPFHETLRDRLISFFESRNLTHKPKLVAVTGFSNSAGVTTTASGLASCLSETGEGNVLLVDLTLGQGSAQHFYKGRAIIGLEEILTTRQSAQVQDKLYVVAQEPNGDRVSRILPQRFSKLVPKLKASDFDYIIFDMPPVSQISVTPRLAGFMDMVLLVVESETTDRDLVRRAAALLSESKAHVGVVLNKTTNYVPAALHQEYLGNA